MSLGVAQDFCVHVVDDDEDVRRTVAFMLSSAGISTRVYDSAASFLDGAHRAPPGCLLTDFRLPGMTGLDLVARLGDAGDRFAVVLMSGYADVSMAVQAMKGGAVDVLQKPFMKEALLSAVGGALDRMRERASAAATREAQDYKAMFNTLSPRQRDVLAGMLAGKQNKAIARELSLSVRTVESYRSEIFAKTQVANLTDLIRKAVMAGL